MGDKEGTRLGLFKIYSQNLSIFFPRLAESVFICPICQNRFSEKDAISDGNQSKLSIAHCYPHASGGDLHTLTCTPCNNRMNRYYDNHLVREANVYEALDPEKTASIPGIVIHGSSKVAASLSVLGDHPLVTLHGERSNEAMYNSVVEHLRSSEPERKNLPFVPSPRVRYEPMRVNIAKAHAAYLMMFRAFGYEFLLSPIAKEMREVLLRDNPPDESNFYLFRVPKSLGRPDLLNTVGVTINDPPDVRCLYAMMPSARADTLGTCVLMPGPGERGLAAATALSRHLCDGFGSLNFRIIPSGNEDNEYRLTRRAYRQTLRSFYFDVSFNDIAMREALLGVYELANGDISASVDGYAIPPFLGLDPEEAATYIQANIEVGLLIASSEPVLTAKVGLTVEGKKLSEDTLAIKEAT